MSAIGLGLVIGVGYVVGKFLAQKLIAAILTHLERSWEGDLVPQEPQEYADSGLSCHCDRCRFIPPNKRGWDGYHH